MLKKDLVNQMQKPLKQAIPVDKKRLDALLQNVGDMALKRRIEYMAHNLEVRKGDRILDCGCGEGFHLVVLNELFPGIQLYGLDYDDKVLQKARQANKKNVKIVQGDIYRLPFKNEFFDKIILSEVLEHLDDDSKALKEVCRALKKNGILVITVPNHDYPFLWDPVNKVLELTTGKHIKNGFFAGIWNMHLRLYSREEILNVVKENNLKVEKMNALTHYCLPFNHIALYGMRRLLERKILPAKVISGVDKFEFKKRKKGLMDVIYVVLHSIDRFNDRVPATTSAVAWGLKVRK